MPRPSANPSGAARLELTDGSRVAVIGGGPAGSFFGFFLLDMAANLGRDLEIDIYEPRDFSGVGPASCNMCGGIISETLVQNLAAEGILLPGDVIQRGIDSYILHTDVGVARIDTPMDEMRIGAVYRATGPRDLKEARWRSFDGYLQSLAVGRGANVRTERVESVEWHDGRPELRTKSGDASTYDLLVVASGVNSTTLKLFDGADLGYRPPETTKTFIREFHLGQEQLDRYLGSSMHVFLLNIPGLEFAAIIPKGDYASVCLLGEDIDRDTLQSFLGSGPVREVMPPGWEGTKAACQCSPKMNVRAAQSPFADRLVFIGDAGVTRLYKDGIGAAYRTAKAAATTAVFQGVSRLDFERHYLPVCRRIERDNATGRLVFGMTRFIQQYSFARRAVLGLVGDEQGKPGRARRMSMVLWDLFTGSATYGHIGRRMLHPMFVLSFLGRAVRALFVPSSSPRKIPT